MAPLVVMLAAWIVARGLGATGRFRAAAITVGALVWVAREHRRPRGMLVGRPA